MNQNNISATELFLRVRELLMLPDLEPATRNKMMHDTLILCCHEGVKNTKQAFGNLFAQVDYLCEMKFSTGNFTITQDTEENIRHKIDAFANSKMHNKTRSIQTVLVTTMGLSSNMHASIINHLITLDQLFQ